MMVSRIKALRRLGMPILRRFGDREITIRHHWTGKRLTLNLFRHRGYWYFGRKRERATIERAQALISPGDTVVELGGHIGYLSMIFAEAVGPSGKVHVFEPAATNLPYIRKNVARLPQIDLHELAVADFTGETSFYSEDLSGQNSSLVTDYSVGKENADYSFTDVTWTEEKVQVTTLDAWCAENGVTPDFIKIDIEGAEFAALRGGKEVLKKHRPVLMVEVTEEVAEVTDFLRSLGYRLETPDGAPVAPGETGRLFNIFALPQGDGA